MDLPIIETPVAPRWVWMEEVTYSHIPIATLVTAFLVMAPIFEYIGYKRGDPRYDRLAKSLVFFSMILFSPGAALGTGIPMFIIGLWPEFWHRWANLFFWPLIVQFLFFLADVGFLFFGYYLCWDRLQDRKRFHLFLGVMTAVFGLLIQAVWDSLGAYMTTPSVPLPTISQPVGLSWAALFNPSFPYLFFHRFFGNISYVMLLTGGVLALKHLAQKDPAEKAYFGWASDLTFTIGFAAFFAMPFIGWGFARVMRNHAAVAFHAVMGGHISSVFVIKMALILFFLLAGGSYVFARYKNKLLPGLLTVGLASLALVLSWHPPVDLLPGGAPAWRVWVVAIPAILIVWAWGFHLMGRTESRWWKWNMFVVGLAAFFAFALGGFVRERARQPYSVYKEIVKPEVTALEADRFLVYDRCLGCHFMSPKDLARQGPRDWAAVVEKERRRPGVNLSDDEAARVVRHLEENY